MRLEKDKTYRLYHLLQLIIEWQERAPAMFSLVPTRAKMLQWILLG